MLIPSLVFAFCSVIMGGFLVVFGRQYGGLVAVLSVIQLFTAHVVSLRTPFVCPQLCEDDVQPMGLHFGTDSASLLGVCVFESYP